MREWSFEMSCFEHCSCPRVLLSDQPISQKSEMDSCNLHVKEAPMSQDFSTSSTCVSAVALSQNDRSPGPPD